MKKPWQALLFRCPSVSSYLITFSALEAQTDYSPKSYSLKGLSTFSLIQFCFIWIAMDIVTKKVYRTLEIWMASEQDRADSRRKEKHSEKNMSRNQVPKGGQPSLGKIINNCTLTPVLGLCLA